MLITIENFGAIKYFQFDTEKDLYLIFGKNSVGKSYAISLVYLILKNLKRFQQSQPNLYPFYGGSFNSMPRDIMFSIYNIISSDFDLIERESNDRAIETQVSDAIKSILHDYFVVGLENSIINTFSDISKLSNKSNKNDLTIKLHWNNNYSLDLSLIKRKLSILNCSFDGGDFLEKLYSQKEFNSSISNNEKINIIFSYIKIIADITKNFSDEFVNNIYFFPASRSGLYLALSNFGQIYAQISSSGTISEPLQIATISEPVADYFLNLTTIKLSEKNNTFVSYAKEIEKNILKGTVIFDNEKKRLLLKPDGFETALDLSIVSSMESEISPIVYYLKYILSSNDIRHC